MSGTEILFWGLVVYRLTRLISTEDGPWDILLEFRELVAWFGQEFPKLGTLAVLVSCPYCLGLWLSIGCALLIAPTFLDVISWSLCIAGAQTLFQVFEDRE